MIQTEQLRKTYNRHSRNSNEVLKGISLTLPDTGFVCILGESGCGKTTLMNVMGGLDVFDGGTLTVNGITIKGRQTKAMEEERNDKFGYIFQNYYLLSERSVAYNVYLGLHSLPLGRREKLKRVKEALDSVGMVPYAKKRVSDLSGGQQQRVAIARALARKPDIIFADEPTGNLDETNTNQVCMLLRQVSSSCLVVMVTHEKRIAEQFADRIISLEAGEIQSDCENTPVSEETALAEQVTEESEQLQGLPKQQKQKAEGWGFRTLLKEALLLLWAKGHRTGWLYACLSVLTAVIVLTVGDYLTTAAIHPEDFIITDERLLEVEIIRGGVGGESLADAFETYLEYLESSGLDFEIVPIVASQTSYHHNHSFYQLRELSENVSGFSYLPLEMCSEDTLIYGRMPEQPEEIVVDRFVLERFLKEDGILQASVPRLSGFLGQTLTLYKKDAVLKIVGICDAGNPTVYMDPYAILTCATAGTSVMSLSQLKERYPGEFDELTLAEGEVYAGPNAGAQRVGAYINVAGRLRYRIAGLTDKDIYAKYIIADDQYEAIARAMVSTTRQFYICSENKGALKKFLLGELPQELKGVIRLDVTDHYTDYMAAYQAAVAERLNTRTIVTATILLISAILLAFLLKARQQERMEFFAVYRMLGVPKSRTLAILALESICLSAVSSLPVVFVTWGIVTALTVLPSISFSMILPFEAAVFSYLAVICFHLAASLLPAARLLRIPPAQLAAKYDF